MSSLAFNTIQSSAEICSLPVRQLTGTGSIAHNRAINIQNASLDLFDLVKDFKSNVAVLTPCTELGAVFSTAEKFKFIDETLGLMVTDYAKIFHVKRATIYNWLSLKTEPDSISIISNIGLMFNICKEVKEFNTFRYGRVARTHTVGGSTLVDLLCVAPLDSDLIKEFCGQLTKKMRAKANAQSMALTKTDKITKSGYFFSELNSD